MILIICYHNNGVGLNYYWLSQSVAQFNFFANDKVISKKNKINSVKKDVTPNSIDYKIYLTNSDIGKLPIINYNNVAVYINNKSVNNRMSQNGGIKLNIKKGVIKIKIKFLALRFFKLSMLLA